jgi:hypothetical protein
MTTKLEVIGVGFGRTGTTSLKEALDVVGLGPCHHMFDLMQDPALIGPWLDAAEGRPADWDAAFAGYRSALDFPTAAFWRELVDHYPDAKVILTVRDPEQWYDSAIETIFAKAMANERRRRHPIGRLGYRFITSVSPELGAFARMTDEAVMQRVFDGRLSDRRHAVEVFRRHNEEVQATVPADRLLTYRVTEGWEPLCDFLGVPVPERSFPRGNDRGTFHREERDRIRRMIRGSVARRLGRAA